MAAHRFKSSFGQCQCYWCGHNRHSPPDCPVTDEVRDALKAFAAKHGNQWKSHLRKLWNSGFDTGPIRLARNIIGPGGIDRVTSKMLGLDFARQ